MRKTTKAQGLTLSTMVIAALVLVVLLIGIAIITGTSNKVFPFFAKQTECETRGGSCVAATDACDGNKVYGLKSSSGSKCDVCCVKS